METFKYSIIVALVCLAALIECEDSNALFLYKSSVTLDCSMIPGDKDDIRFFRETPPKVNETKEPEEIKEKDDKYDIDDGKLTIKDLRREDIESKYFCQNKDDKKKRFINQIQPFVARPEKASQTIVEGGYVEFSCRLLYGNESNGTVSWKWTKNGTLVENTDKIAVEHNVYETKLNISKISEADRGEYECELENEFGKHKEKVQLRVKNALAALWPFLAIVAEVIILCLIILIYEKKCSKKPNQNEEENEQTQNLMNRDNDHNSDLKKRTAKA